jgi:DNA (cytosine-5)-methyltransferase 1
VAQRRRRVFVVGHLGDWRPAAAVLFERHSLQGHPAPSREKRQGASATITARTGISRNNHGELVGWPADISSTLNASFGSKLGLENQHINADCPMFVPTKAFYESSLAQYKEADVGGTLKASGGVLSGGSETFLAQPIAFTTEQTPKYNHDQALTLTKSESKHNQCVAAPIAFSGQMSNPQTDVEMTGTLQAKNPMAVMQPVAYNIAPGKGSLKDDIHVTDAYATKTLDASGSNPAMHQGGAAILQPIAYAFDSLASNSMKSANPNSGCNEVDVSKTLDTSRGLDPSCNQGGIGVAQSMAVRRLTPVECERLQGFSDNYTDIKSKNKPTPDGPRYKALGNSMAVPVMAWIGQRIEQVEAICKQNK